MRTHYKASTRSESRRHSVPAPKLLLSTAQIDTPILWSPHDHPAAILASKPAANAKGRYGYLPVPSRNGNSPVVGPTPLKSFSSGLVLQRPRSTALSPNQSSSLPTRYYEVKRRKPCAIDNSYRRLKTLGKGNFGKVYLAEDRQSKLKVAIKVVDKHSLNNREQRAHAHNERKISEAISRFQHDTIVNVHDVIQDDAFIWIIMEFVEGGELFERIKAQGRLEESEARRLFREIMEGVRFLHKLDIVHRDLKPENILLDRNGHIRICDFGFAKVCHKKELLETYCGSPYYAAPEMVTATPYSGPAADIWSCGVILYTMLSGKLPFQSENTSALFEKISTGNYSLSKHICSEAAELISKMLCVEPELRPTAELVLQHPWLKRELAECPPSPVQQYSSRPPAPILSPIHPHRPTTRPRALDDSNLAVLQRLQKSPQTAFSATRRTAKMQGHSHSPQEPGEPFLIPPTPTQLSRSSSFASQALERKPDSGHHPHRYDSQRGRNRDIRELQDKKQRHQSTISSQLPIGRRTRPKRNQISPELATAESFVTSNRGKSPEVKMVDRVKNFIKNPFHKKDA